MAGVADDWEANRQTCVDVLCAYLYAYEPTRRLLAQSAEQGLLYVRQIVRTYVNNSPVNTK
jgi:hypothetical protein